MQQRYIAVEGPIGVGKTTLCKKLATQLNAEAVLERADENPFLEKFYRNNGEGALATQLFFLFQRAQQINGMRQNDLFASRYIADFLIDKDRLFARTNLDSDEYQLYEQVYQQTTIDAPKPDLVIYLQAPVDVLMQRILQRGVPAEQSIDLNYLEKLNDAYCDFFHFYDAAPLLIINATQIDFANNDEHFEQLTAYMSGITSGKHYFNPSYLDDTLSQA
jgi:deoxyadenosine/deoxycytidine kinase